MDTEPNKDAPYLGQIGEKFFLADPLSNLQLRVPGGLILKKLVGSSEESGPHYILDTQEEDADFTPRFVHKLLQSSKATELSWLELI